MIVHDLHEDSLSSSALTLLAKVTFRLMRLAAREELVVANAADIAGWLDEVHETYGYDDYWTLMEYVAAAGEESGMIEAIVEHTDEKVRPAATSTLEKLQAKAREEVLQGFRAVVERQLELRFGRLSARVRAKVGRATKRQLERWAPRVITAATLAEVFEPRE